MIARRTRRKSSSLFPLNMTPAITSIHPPVWWNGPLGPLTTGRDLYEVGLPGRACRVRHGERRPAGRVAELRERRTFRGQDDLRADDRRADGHREAAHPAGARLYSSRTTRAA